MANFHVDYNYRDHLNAPRRIVADLAITVASGAGNTITSGVGSSSVAFSGVAGSSPQDVFPIPNYLGCFRLDNGATTDTLYRTQFSFPGFTGRKVGGNVRILICGHKEDGLNVPIIEVEDPGSYSTDYTTAPIATRTGYWTANYASARGTWRGALASDTPVEPYIAVPNVASASLHWNEDLDRLYLTYYDAYNVGQFQDWGLLSIELSALDANGEGTTTGRGPWRLKATDGDGTSFYGPWRGLLLSPHPVTGKLITGASLNSGNASGSWGPSLYGELDWPTDSTPSGVNETPLTLTKRWMNHYYMGGKLNSDGTLIAPNPLRSFRRRLDPPLFEPFPGQIPASLQVNGQVYTDAIGLTGSWNEMDYVWGQAWIQGTTKAGILFCGNAAGSPSQDTTDPLAGHEYYGNDLNGWVCTHGFDYNALFVPPRDNPATGPNTHAAFPWLCCYDPAEIMAQENTTNDYVAEPVWFINLETQFPGFKTGIMGKQGFKLVIGFYYDEDTRKLYMGALQADDSRFGKKGTLIHVFQWDED